MSSGIVIALVAVVVALAFGLHRLRTDGRFSSARAGTADAQPSADDAPPADGQRVAAEVPGVPATWQAVLEAVPSARLGRQATLLQFSSAFCAPCRATKRTLSEVADVVPGVVHLEVDAEHHLDLVRRLDVLRTPTTLVLDATGVEIARAAGAPRKEQVLQALGRA
ncbi:MAG: thioredoxin family protein [Nocardioides kribbensis]